VNNALVSVRLEGREVSDEAKAIFQRYVDGALSEDAMDREIDALWDRKYGPIREAKK
jgi:Antitoxin VbhA